METMLNIFIIISLTGGWLYFVGEVISLYKAYKLRKFRKDLNKKLEMEIEEASTNGWREYSPEEIIKLWTTTPGPKPTKKPTRSTGSKTKIKKS